MELEVGLRSALHLLLLGHTATGALPRGTLPDIWVWRSRMILLGIAGHRFREVHCEVFRGDFAFHKGLILRLQLPILLNPLFQGEAVQSRDLHTPVKPIGGITSPEVKISLPLGQHGVGAKPLQFIVDAFDGKTHV